MQASSGTLSKIAGALAKAQAELKNPEKSLTATIPSTFPREQSRTFNYASLASGLEIVRKCLSRQEIATVQTTAIAPETSLIKLTTTLLHTSGEWISSDWPVCLTSETAVPHRMGAALTYARRYALFTLVGIAGEDDLDAPELNGGLEGTVPLASSKDQSNHRAAASDHIAPESPAAAAQPTQRGRIKPPRVILDAENSRQLAHKLLAELAALTDSEALTTWAGRILPLKNQLITSDAQKLEKAFADQLTDFSVNAPIGDAKVGITVERDNGELNIDLASKSGAKHNNAASPRVREMPKHSMTPIGKTLRLRDRDHLKFVSAQPCLACGRSPSDAHHLKFAQGRALARKVSDEYTVPLCRSHHRELHRRGDERAWWQQLGIDPLLTASALWVQTHPALAEPVWASNGANGALNNETKPFIPG